MKIIFSIIVGCLQSKHPVMSSHPPFLIVRSLVCAMFVFWSSVSHAATYYVDSVGGNDSSNGLSISSPWKTLTKVNATTFAPGDVLLFKRAASWAGTITFKGSGNAMAPITVDCYDTNGVIGPNGVGALPVIAGDSTSDFTVYLPNISYWTVSDLEIHSGLRASISVWCTSIPVGSQMSGIMLQRLVIRNTSSRGVLGAGIYCYNDGANQRTFDNLIISECDIQNVNCLGIYLQSTNLKANTNIASYYNTNVLIAANYIAQTNASGITATGCKDVMIDSNVVDHVGSYLNSGTTYFVGIFPGSCWGGTVQNNVVSNTDIGYDSQAFDLDEWNSGTFYFQYNYSHDNYGGFFQTTNNSLNDGLIPDIANHCILRFNVSSNDDLHANASNKNSVMLLCLTGQHQEFYYNTFYCATGPAIVNKRWCNPPSFEAVFKNNIFYCPSGFYSCVSGGSNSTNPCTYDYNCFFSGNGGLGTNQINADPYFVGSSDNLDGLKLASASPCVNAGIAGISNPVPQEDMYGYTYDLGTTLGADQLENVMSFQFENTLADSSGHNNNGTLGGSGSSFVSGAQSGSYCLSLSGSGYATVANSQSTNLITNELCIDLWVQVTGTSGYRRLVDKLTSGSNDGFLLDVTPGNKIRFNVRGWQIITTGTIPTGSVWSHITARWMQGGTMAIYINGSQDIQQNCGNTPAWATSNTWPFRIGADQNGSQRLAGRLDNVQIRRSCIVRP